MRTGGKQHLRATKKPAKAAPAPAAAAAATVLRKRSAAAADLYDDEEDDEVEEEEEEEEENVAAMDHDDVDSLGLTASELDDDGELGGSYFDDLDLAAGAKRRSTASKAAAAPAAPPRPRAAAKKAAQWPPSSKKTAAATPPLTGAAKDVDDLEGLVKVANALRRKKRDEASHKIHKVVKDLRAKTEKAATGLDAAAEAQRAAHEHALRAQAEDSRARFAKLLANANAANDNFKDEARSIHWFPYDRVYDVDADP